MASVRHPSIVMLGPAPGSLGGIAAVLDAYRTQGLFARWPIEYVAANAAGRFAAVVARERRAVLHVHAEATAAFWRDALYTGAALAAGWPVILHLHGGGFERLLDASGLAGRSLIDLLLRHAACVAVPSQRMAAALHSITPEVRATVLPAPVVMAPLPPAAARANLILFLGTLHADKGLFDLLDALSRLRAAVPDVRLVCAGRGDRAAVAAYARRLGIDGAVKFTGWVGPSGKRVLLESAAVYALPSYAEGLPMTLLEAMAAGVPAVASTVGAIPEVVSDGISGFLVAPGDSATLERRLRELLLKRDLACRVGAAGHESVRRRFAAEHAVPQLEAIYARLGVQAGMKASPWPASQAG